MKRLLFTLVMVLLFGAARAQSAQCSELCNCINSGNVACLLQKMDGFVEITINNTRSTYSKAQAEMVLRDFFTKHNPKLFSSEQNGGMDTGFFNIGYLSTNDGRFRVFLLMGKKDHNYYLQELRFEK